MIEEIVASNEPVERKHLNEIYILDQCHQVSKTNGNDANMILINNK